MVDNKLNKKWKEDFFEIFATKSDVKELENADKIKIEHFPPVLGPVSYTHLFFSIIYSLM